MGSNIVNWLILLQGGQLDQISPTQLYRQISRAVLDTVETLGKGVLSITTLVNHFDRIRPRKQTKKHPTTRQTNVTYGLS